MTDHSFSDLMRRIDNTDGNIDVLWEYENNCSIDIGTWTYTRFDSIEKCAKYFIKNYFIVEEEYLLCKDDYSIEENELTIGDTYTFIFRNKKL